MRDTNDIGVRGQKAVASWLRVRGFLVYETGRWAPFDLYTRRGTTIEVKVGEPYRIRGRLGWGFRIARHGKMCRENCVDFYIFRLEPGPQLRHLGIEIAMHLVCPASVITAKFVWVSLHALLTKYAGLVDKTQAINEADTAKSAKDLAKALIRSRRYSSQSASLRKKMGLSEEEVAEVTREQERIIASESAVRTLLARIASEPLSPAELEDM